VQFVGCYCDPDLVSTIAKRLVGFHAILAICRIIPNRHRHLCDCPKGATPRMKNTLRVLRAERGWSQAALAEKLGVSRQTINAIETGKYDPSLPLAFALAKLLGKQIEEIFLPQPLTPELKTPEPMVLEKAKSPNIPSRTRARELSALSN
jgi:putative transcriptional regulator